jgi:hypothetical protein
VLRAVLEENASDFLVAVVDGICGAGLERKREGKRKGRGKKGRREHVPSKAVEL